MRERKEKIKGAKPKQNRLGKEKKEKEWKAITQRNRKKKEKNT